MATAQELLIVIDAATEQMRRELKRADTAVAQASTKMDRSLAKVDAAFSRLNVGASAAVDGVNRAMGALGIALGGAALVQGIEGTLTRLVEMKRTADSLGASVEGIQGLAYAFRQFGLDTEDVADALNTLADRAQDAIDGTQSMVDDFGLLGISVDQLRGKNPVELFRLFAEAVRNTEEPTRRSAGVVRALGDDLGRKLYPMLLQGAEGLDRLMRGARAAGQVVKDEAFPAIARAEQALRDIKEASSGAFTQAVANNAGTLADTLERINASIRDPNFQGALQKIATFMSAVLLDTTEAMVRFNRALEDLRRLQIDDVLLNVLERLADVSGPGFLYRLTHGGQSLSDRLGDVLSGRGDTATPAVEAPPAPAALPAPGAASGAAGAAVDPSDLQRARALIEANRTELERYRDKLAEIKRLLAHGLIDDETFSRAFTKIKAELAELETETFTAPARETTQVIAGLGTLAEATREAGAIFESTRTPIERYTAELEKLKLMFANGLIDEDTFTRQAKQLKTELDTTDEKLTTLQGLGQQFGAAISSSFSQAVVAGESLGDTFEALAEQLAQLVTQQFLLKAVTEGLNYIPGFSSSGGGTAKASAHGNVFDRHGLVPFAAGGIVTRPTVFPFARGTGLMGEAGPEAILPLKRIGGDLGVKATGAGVTINVINQSQAQVSARQQRRPDGQQVIDLMVEDSFNRLLGSGRLDQSLAANMGVRRPGRF